MKRKSLKISQNTLFVYKSARVNHASVTTDPTTEPTTLTITMTTTTRNA